MKADNIRLPEEGFIRLDQVLSVIPVGERTWYRGMKQGTFPKPKKIMGNINAWDVAEIRSLIRALGGTVHSSPQLAT